jgi:uncharacterized Zn finger protein
MGYDYGFPPYVPVAKRRAMAAKKMAQLKKQGKVVQPVILTDRRIAKTFWGKSWCDNLESYSDFANRLPRGRTYVRNGSVIDLQIQPGKITALVSGSEIYTININVKPLSAVHWQTLVMECAGQFNSMVELLQGHFSQSVMAVITQPKKGLFPYPQEIELKCSCPDYASLCKHVAAVLYGVGARLDETPELLFLLRQVNHADLLVKAGQGLVMAPCSPDVQTLQGANLSVLFGIALEEENPKKKAQKEKGMRKLSKVKKKSKARNIPKVRNR